LEKLGCEGRAVLRWLFTIASDGFPENAPPISDYDTVAAELDAVRPIDMGVEFAPILQLIAAAEDITDDQRGVVIAIYLKAMPLLLSKRDDEQLVGFVIECIRRVGGGADEWYPDRCNHELFRWSVMGCLPLSDHWRFQRVTNQFTGVCSLALEAVQSTGWRNYRLPVPSGVVEQVQQATPREMADFFLKDAEPTPGFFWTHEASEALSYASRAPEWLFYARDRLPSLEFAGPELVALEAHVRESTDVGLLWAENASPRDLCAVPERLAARVPPLRRRWLSDRAAFERSVRAKTRRGGASNPIYDPGIEHDAYQPFLGWYPTRSWLLRVPRTWIPGQAHGGAGFDMEHAEEIARIARGFGLQGTLEYSYPAGM